MANGIPHISSAPFDVQVREAYDDMLRRRSNVCPSWAGFIVCQAATVAYNANQTEGLTPTDWVFFPDDSTPAPTQDLWDDIKEKASDIGERILGGAREGVQREFGEPVYKSGLMQGILWTLAVIAVIYFAAKIGRGN